MQKHKSSKQHPSKKKQVRQTETWLNHPKFFWVLPLLVFLFYLPSLFNDFVNWDDYAYIVENPYVQNFNFKAVRELFYWKTFQVGNYHPLTMISLGIEHILAGNEPWLYHLDNIFLHMANTVLVYFLIRILAGSNMIAFITAFLFGLHPMRVESVTWAAERKDVLYTFFFLLASITYLIYLNKNRDIKFFILSILFFILSCFSKGQAVVLPLTLIIFDIYLKRSSLLKSVLKKWPYFLIALVFGWIAIQAQSSSFTTQHLTKYPFLDRIIFACYGWEQYIFKLIAPVKLACFYAYPFKNEGFYPWYVYTGIPAVGLSVWAVWKYRQNKVVLIGALYFAFTIAIVLQILPVGDAYMADRYSYIPYLGLFFIIAHIIGGIPGNIRTEKNVPGMVLAGLLFCYPFMTFSRTLDWRDNEKLWTNVIRNYPETAVAYNNRGVDRLNKDRIEDALRDFQEAIRFNPSYYEAYNNAANAMGRLNNHEEEIKLYNKALEIAPDYTTGYFNRGLAFATAGKHDLALKDYQLVISREPFNAKAYYSAGLAYKNLGQDSLAIRFYSIAIEKDPKYIDAFNNRGNIYFKLDRPDQAIADYNMAISLDPKAANAYRNRAAAEYKKGDFQAAVDDANKAQEMGLQIDPQFFQVLYDSIKKQHEGGTEKK